MTGPEHYRKAGELLRLSNRHSYGPGANHADSRALSAEATVHAELARTALDAFTAIRDTLSEGTRSRIEAQWAVVLGGNA